jgi:hypothetical protein
MHPDISKLVTDVRPTGDRNVFEVKSLVVTNGIGWTEKQEEG